MSVSEPQIQLSVSVDRYCCRYHGYIRFLLPIAREVGEVELLGPGFVGAGIGRENYELIVHSDRAKASRQDTVINAWNPSHLYPSYHSRYHCDEAQKVTVSDRNKTSTASHKFSS